MLAAVHDARDAAARPRGGDRLAPAADLDRPGCTSRAAASCTTRASGSARCAASRRSPSTATRWSRVALLRAGRRPDPGQGPQREVLRRAARWPTPTRRPRREPGPSPLAASLAAACSLPRVLVGLLERRSAAPATRATSPATGIITGSTPADRKQPGAVVRARRSTAADARPGRLPRQGRRASTSGARGARRAARRRRRSPAAARELRRKGVVFLGINTRDPERGQRAGLRAPLPASPTRASTTPTAGPLLAFHGTLPPSAIPSTLVIDPQGRVAASVLGEITQRPRWSTWSTTSRPGADA